VGAGHREEARWKTVRDILAAKDQRVCSIHPKATVFDALKLMSEMEIRRGDGARRNRGRCAGFLSERDYARKIPGLRARPHAKPRMAEIMTPVEHMPYSQTDQIPWKTAWS